MVIFNKSIVELGVADGTVEQGVGTFSPEEGKQWHLVGIVLNIAADPDAIVYSKINRRNKCEYNGNNLPSYPDLIPLDGIIGTDDEYKFTITNNTGAAQDFYITFFYEEQTAGG